MKSREEKIQVRESQKKERTLARNVRKVANRCVFPMICGSGGSNSRLAKAAGAEPCRQRRNEKLHAAVARSAISSQNCKNTPCSDHFFKLGCGKMARRCGTKHISKSKCTKHTMVEWLDHFLKFTRRKIARRCSEKHICKSKSQNTDGLGPLS